MNADTFLENFGHLADAPGGIPKLREIILQLAVRGKLIEHDTEHPASSLVAKMRDDKRRKMEDGTLRKSKPLPPVESNEAPFHLSSSWEWVRIGDAVSLANGRAFKPADWSDSGLPIIRIQNLNNPNAAFNHCETAVDDRFHVRDDDLLISWSGTPGTSFGAFIWDRGPAVLNQHIFRAELHGPAFQKPFLRCAINSQLEAMIAQAHGGVGLRHITKGKLEHLCIPLPPWNEQHRIVAKVDELMALCGELEARQQDRRTVHVHLNNAALDRLTSAENDTDFKPAWTRVRSNFDLLYSVPENVNALRQTILQLGVQGKLVEQDPDDEPASVLLDTIRDSANATAKSSKRKKRSSTPEPENGLAYPFQVPQGWQWAEFCDVATIASNLVKPDAFPDVPHVAPNNIEKATGRLLEYRSVAEDKVRSANHRFFPGQLLYSKIRPNLSKATMVNFEGLCSADMYPINAHIDSAYLLQYILSATFLSMAVKTDTRVAMPKINQAELNKVLVAVPPLPEQHRIVAKVDKLMVLCDELETKLTQQQTDADRLTEAVVAAILDGSTVAPPTVKQSSGASIREIAAVDPVIVGETGFGIVQGAISSYAVNQLHNRKSFGRTQHAKVLSLVQSHVGLDLGIEFQRLAAGPFHPCIYDLERTAKKNKWYRTKKRTGKSQTAYQYHPGQNINEQVQIASNLLGKKQPEMDRLLSLFSRMRTRRAELIATTFFVWNDFILEGKSPSEAEITKDFFNWHESKRKKFTPAKVTEAINWLRNNDMVPTGKGRKTVPPS